MELLAAGLAPLFLFIQENWTGPNELANETLLLPINDLRCKINILQELVIDGENVVSTLKLPELLYLSKVVLEAAYLAFAELQVIYL